MREPVKGTDKGQGKNKGANNMGKGKNPMAVCYKCGQPGHLAKDCRTAEQQFTTCRTQHMSNTMTTRHNGITQTTATMPTGIAVTKQATTRTVGNNTSNPNKHHNLRLQHLTNQQRKSHRRQQYIVWQHWTTRCQQHHWHQHFSQSNRMKPRSTL